MIDDLSRSLRAILDDPGLATPFPELADAQISFERPSETFNPAQTTIDLFLYDVRENVELRDNTPSVTRLNGQVAIGRPPLRVACWYLVTAWPVGGIEPPLQEHRLLSQALQVFSALPTIPPGFLQGALVGQEPPLPLLAAQADGLSNPAEFWTALGNRLRPSFTLMATVAIPVGVPVLAPAAITHEVRLEQIDLPGTEVSWFLFGGRVTDAASAAVAGATVLLVEPNLSTTTDAEGRYHLGSVAAGTFTLRVTLGAVTQEVTITVPAPAGSNYDVQLP
jgi:hypothetical protein